MTIHRNLGRAVLCLCLSLCLSLALLLGAGAAQAAPHAVDGSTVTLDLGHVLDQRKLLDPADFAVTASGTAVAVLSASFAANGKGVDLGLARAPAAGAAVEVTYTWPWSGEGLWTASGYQIDSFTLNVRAPGMPALTASFRGLPAAHDGASRFEFEISFSEEIAGLTLATVRSALAVTGGRLVDVRRTVQGRNGRMTARVRPAGDGDVTLALAATADCTAAGAICARDGRKLGAVSATVPGPADTVPPAPVSAAVDGSLMTVSFDEDLAEPATTEWFKIQWTIDGTGLRHHPNRAWLSDRRTVSLEISTTHPAVAGQTVTVGYWASDFLRDAAGNRVADFTLTAAVAGAAANAAATGVPTISGTAQVGQTLTASTIGIADEDGLTNATFAYQWVAVREGTGTDIAGATASTYTLKDADAGAAIRVRVSFTDDAGNAETLVSAATAPVALPPLTAAFTGLPAEHDGARRFEFGIRFSEEIPGLRLPAVRAALRVTNGKAVAVKRAAAGLNRNITVQVRPDGVDDVTIGLPATADCAAAGAICTADGRRLESALSATVRGPVAISVADAEAREGEDAAVTFTVTLSRAASGEVSVDYATRDGTAKAGEDYTYTRGTLAFAAGETEGTVSVPVLDDEIDEGEETFTLKLTNPRGAAIDDGEATGTIMNDDPIPTAWLARFGRTVAEQSVDAVRSRMSADRTPGFRGRLAGEALPSVTGTADGADAGMATDTAETATAEADEAGTPDDPFAIPEFAEGERLAFLALLAPQDDEGGDGRDGATDTAQSRTGTAEEAMLGTAFEIMRETDGGLSLGLWGRVARSGFSGREEGMDFDGDVTSAMLGTDWTRRDALFGLMLFRSRGEGGYSGPTASGRIEAELSGLVPWAGRRKDGAPTIWGAAGTGRGEMTLAPEGRDAVTAGLDWSMAAAGADGVPVTVAALGGANLRWRADALMTRTDSEAVRSEGMNLDATSAETSRLRLGLEAAWSRSLASGATLVPRLELGLRRDGGDAETGFGIEAGGGVRFEDPGRGLSVSFDGRALALHEDGDLEDWGLAVSMSWDPRPETRLGPSVIATRGWGGAPAGGVAALLEPEALPGVDDGTGGGAGSLGIEMAWGTDLSGWRHGMTGSAYGRVSGGPEAKDLRLGWRLAPDLGFPESLGHDFWLEPGTGAEAAAGAGLSWSSERRRVRSSTGIDLGAREGGGVEAGLRLTREW